MGMNGVSPLEMGIGGGVGYRDLVIGRSGDLVIGTSTASRARSGDRKVQTGHIPDTAN
jgi:hypothetical protein